MLIATDLLKAALLCASTEQTRYYLNGVHLSTSGHMVTTDGHRMFVAKLAETVLADVIIPTATVQAALKLAGARVHEIELNGNTLGGVVFQPVDGTFPEWRRVIPTGEEMPSDKPDDAPGRVHFNASYIGDLAKMGKALDGAPMLHPRTASNPCLVTFGERADCLAVLMPVRRAGDVMHGAHVRNTVLA